jgi:Bacterial HORMA domain family 1
MSSTHTSTFTVTHAEYLASKIAADLRQMQSLYGKPTDNEIANFQQEVVLLLKEGYLGSIDYGYKKDGKWVVALSYEANNINGQLIDNNPGRVPVGVNIAGADWYSYLRKSTSFYNLSQAEQEAVESRINIKRHSASDPQTGLTGQYDKIYSASDQQINRKVIK